MIGGMNVPLSHMYETLAKPWNQKTVTCQRNKELYKRSYISKAYYNKTYLKSSLKSSFTFL